jgi:hypothetical protein
MVKRYCLKCNAIFDRKSSYDKHINKKYDCAKNYIEIQNDPKYSKMIQNIPNCYKICENNNNSDYNNSDDYNSDYNNSDYNNSDYNNTNDIDINMETNITNNDRICCFCYKLYSSKSNLNKHLKVCKIKRENDIEKENIFRLLLEKDILHKEEIEELKKHNKEEVNELKKQNKLLLYKIDKLIDINTKSKINNNNGNNQITNNQITNNTQNNIVMVNFGKEDLQMIDNKIFLERVIKNNLISGVKIPDEILKIIHFNNQYPQLSNIYISDINREKCMIYEDGEWKLSPVDKIPEIMNRVVLFSTNTINEFRTKYPNNQNLNDRLNTIEKYTNMIDSEYIEDLRDYEGNNNLIKRCEDFQKKTYNTFKTTLYNEGKKLKKNL